jgi:hypothetical protein
LSPLQLAQLRTARELKRHKYAHYPQVAVGCLAVAIVLSIIFKPTLVPCLLALGFGLLSGTCAAYGLVSKHRRLESIAESLAFAVFLVPMLVINNVFDPPLDWGFAAMMFWGAFGMTAPFWIWRRRGLARYGTPEPVGT